MLLLSPHLSHAFLIFFGLTIHSQLLHHVSFDPPNIPCKPTGLIRDTACDYDTVDDLNQKLAHQLLLLVRLPIFRYHKVDLYRQCPFWSEDGLCGNQACAVVELDEKQVPAYWRASELSDLKTTHSSQVPIDLGNKCVVKEQDYCVLDHQNGVPSNGVYVDLLDNPERFTGYSGPSAHRVWQAIYDENCFNFGPRPWKSPFGSTLSPPNGGHQSLPAKRDRNEDACLEQRVYYKLLSGLHASISIHICDRYLDPQTGHWVPNLQCYVNRIGLHPERLTYLYFTYTLMLRALSRSASYLNSPRVELCTGDALVDHQTRDALTALVRTARSYPVTFDETTMFKASSNGHSNLKEEFKRHFRNVSQIMDCVGCDKCRLWGKLQVTGLATALKLLFEYERDDLNDGSFHLTRPELIALINTLTRFSESLRALEKFRKLWEQRETEGTLPLDVKDERADASPSGRAAKVIASTSGLGPRPELSTSQVDMPVCKAVTNLVSQDHEGHEQHEVLGVGKGAQGYIAGPTCPKGGPLAGVPSQVAGTAAVDPQQSYGSARRAHEVQHQPWVNQSETWAPPAGGWEWNSPN